MSNHEDDDHKTGWMGELLVKLKLNYYGLNTGSVDKDTGTDIVIFHKGMILTAQVKSGNNKWNYNPVHGVHLHFRVYLKHDETELQLEGCEIKWSWVGKNEFTELNRGFVYALNVRWEEMTTK